MKKIFLIIIGLLFVNSISNAQKTNGNLTEADQALIDKLSNKSTPAFFGFSFTNAVAQGILQTNMQKSDVGAGQGFSFYGGYVPEGLPIGFGGDINFIFWSSDEKNTKYGGFPYYYDTLTASNSAIPINAFIKFQPNILSWLSPYVEGFAGLTVYSGSLDFKSNYSSMNQNETFSKVSWNYGVGAGTLIKLGQSINLPDAKTVYSLDIKARYSLGTETDFKMKYLKSDGQILSNDFKSKTDVIYVSVGFLFQW
jgi:hypothetical protein